VSTTFPPQQPGNHSWANLLRLVGAVRRIAYDPTLDPADAMRRIRDLLSEHDQSEGGLR
jgi:hypothetical protein